MSAGAVVGEVAVAAGGETSAAAGEASAAAAGADVIAMPSLAASRARRGPTEVVVSGMSVLSAFGAGVDALLRAAVAGTSGFAPVERFDVGARRAKVAAVAPGSPELVRELINAVDEACDGAGLARSARADCHLFLAIHGEPHGGADAFAAGIAAACGFAGARAYTSACVAASTAVADAAALIAHGRVQRVVVAAGYLVDADQYALFDAGRALALDGRVRPFSAGRSGLLLGDAVGALVLEAASAAEPLARIAGWGRSGDAYHVCKPRPDGHGLARAIGDALHRGGVEAAGIGYINAHGSGTKQSDAAESAALRVSLGEAGAEIPVSSTKSVHGQALEAGALLELILTIAAVRAGRLPLNAGYLGPDEDCPLALVLAPVVADLEYALTLNVAFGGANTALLVGAP
ncbi:3-oxoacyl-[acyl-carrier-protein] synthase II [Catenulispora sp. MAP5-51]